MPRRNTNTDVTPGDEENLHPIGVAGDPEATNPHEADPTPNDQSTARKVNVGITDNAFEVVGDAPERSRSGVLPRGRQLNDSTVAALQFLRQNEGKYCKVGQYSKPGAPSPRLQWAGMLRDQDGDLRHPTAAEEKSTLADDYDVRRKIAYTYRGREDGDYDLLLCLTDEDWTPPKKRGPRKNTTTDVNTTTTNADGSTDAVSDDIEEGEPSEAIG